MPKVTNKATAKVTRFVMKSILSAIHRVEHKNIIRQPLCVSVSLWNLKMQEAPVSHKHEPCQHSSV